MIILPFPYNFRHLFSLARLIPSRPFVRDLYAKAIKLLMKLRYAIALAFVFLAITALPLAPVQAKEDLTELSLEQLLNVNVYGASKFPRKLAEAPSAVSIVTSEDISKYGYRTLADVLKDVRGFTVSYDRNYTYLNVREFGRSGDYNGRILVLVDGNRINANIFDSVGLGTGFILDL